MYDRCGAHLCEKFSGLFSKGSLTLCDATWKNLKVSPWCDCKKLDILRAVLLHGVGTSLYYAAIGTLCHVIWYLCEALFSPTEAMLLEENTSLVLQLAGIANYYFIFSILSDILGQLHSNMPHMIKGLVSQPCCTVEQVKSRIGLFLASL